MPGRVRDRSPSCSGMEAPRPPAAGWAFSFFCGRSRSTCSSALRHNDLLRAEHPAIYERLARIGNYPSHWIDRITGVRYGALSTLTVRFPKDRIATARAAACHRRPADLRDQIYHRLRRAGQRAIVLGFDHRGYGGLTTPPIPVDYRPARTRSNIEMGPALSSLSNTPISRGVSRYKASRKHGPDPPFDRRNDLPGQRRPILRQPPPASPPHRPKPR